MLTYPDQTAVSTRDLAWNTAGESLTDTAMTAEEALRLGGLAGWNTRYVPLTAGIGDHEGAEEDWGTEFPEHRGVIADIGGKRVALGVVGTKHHIVQNEETTSLLDTIVDESGANFVASGLMRGGRQTFVVMKMPQGILVDGQDAHDHYLGCTNHHDGGGSLVAWSTLMRLRCTNMLNGSVKGAKSSWRLRHTASIGGRVQEARASLRLSFAWAEEFETALNSLLARPMSSTEFDAFVEHIAPPSESDKAGWIARAEEKRGMLRHLFHDAATNEFGRGTRYAAYNAATEYADHLAPIRVKSAAARAERNLMDLTKDGFKQAALDALLLPA